MSKITDNTTSWDGHTNLEVEEFLKGQALYELLAKKPEIIKRTEKTDDDIENNNVGIYEINHPLINYPGAECVLVIYHKNIRKKRNSSFKSKFGQYGKYKKGFCVCCSDSWGEDHENRYFDFLKNNRLTIFQDFIVSCMNDGHNSNFNCGIVLRIPNPEYTGPTTTDRNATYKGVKEMLWSDIKKINVSAGCISYDDNGDMFIDGVDCIGIGLT